MSQVLEAKTAATRLSEGGVSMRPHSVLPPHAARRFLRRPLTTILACVLLIVAVQTTAAQCLPNPTGETAVGLRNASSYYLLFFIDEMRMDGVPQGDQSIYFVVAPGEHRLRAEAVIGGETVSASRTSNIPEGYVCTWTVTDPPGKAGGEQKGFRDSLRREPKPDYALRGVRPL
jgi:hypothetical protein